jgi:hypothetical protein
MGQKEMFQYTKLCLRVPLTVDNFITHSQNSQKIETAGQTGNTTSKCLLHLVFELHNHVFSINPLSLYYY